MPGSGLATTCSSVVSSFVLGLSPLTTIPIQSLFQIRQLELRPGTEGLHYIFFSSGPMIVGFTVTW